MRKNLLKIVPILCFVLLSISANAGFLTLTFTTTNASAYGICDGSATVTSDGLAPFTYHWSNGQLTPTISNLCAGSYSATVTDASGFQGTGTVTIVQPTQLMLNLTSTNASAYGICDGSASVSVSGGIPPYSYHWSTQQLTQTITGLCAGTYTITVYDANQAHCYGTVTINQPAPTGGCQVHFGYQVSPANNMVYFNAYAWNTDSSQITNASWFWNFGDGSSGAVQNPTHTFNSTHAYVCVTVTTYDSLQNVTCTSTFCDSIMIGTDPCAGFYVATSTTNPSASGQCDGIIMLNPMGGTPPYQYYWDNGATTQNMDNLCEGSYYVSVIDANQCATGVSAYLYADSTTNDSTIYLYFDTYPTTDSIYCDGYASVYPYGGTPPYYYIWNTGDTAPDLYDLCNGYYEVTVYDNMQNFATGGVWVDFYNDTTIYDSTLYITYISVSDASGANFCDGSAYIEVSGGTPPYNYYFANGAASGSSYIDNLCPGTSTVYVTDANGFSTTATFVVGTANQYNCYAYFGYYNSNTSPYFFHFQDDSYSSTSIIYWYWEFGDGVTATTQSPTHTYASDGYYQVCLYIHTADSCFNSYCEYIYVGQQNTTPTDSAFASIDSCIITSTVDTAYINNVSPCTNGGVYMEWYIIMGADTFIFPVQYAIGDTGVYYVTLVVECYGGNKAMYGFSDIVEVTPADLILSMQNLPAAEQKIAVYPNPVTDKLYITINNAGSPVKEISIINSLGQVVYTKNNFSSLGNLSTNVDVYSLQQGLYFVRILLNNEKSVMYKFVK